MEVPNPSTRDFGKRKQGVRCSKCPKTFCRPNVLKLHLKSIHEGVPTTCPICQLVFPSEYHLSRHHKRTHDTSYRAKTQVSCSICEKKLANADSRKNHMLIHQDDTFYHCLWCENRGFKKLYHFEKHLQRKHIKERPYSCAVCSKSFVDLYASRRHCVSRTGGKYFVSPGVKCEKQFRLKRSLQFHMKRLASCNPKSDFEQKNNHCSMCPKAFWAKSELKNHMAAHIGEKPFSCPLCHKSFTLMIQLKNHASVHSEERSYICSHCPKAFKCKNTLNRHTLFTFQWRLAVRLVGKDVEPKPTCATIVSVMMHQQATPVDSVL